tara:strand:+ start:82 stop:441 length:360 start_codon:yes stop_codon:yes gene_type:complete
MPIYTFINPETEEEIDLVQSMKEPHVYVDENGLEWKRKWTLPNAAIDVDIDPFDKQAFKNKVDGGTGKGTVGELWDRSRELSEKRKQKLGYDPVKKEYLDKYSKERRGRKLPSNTSGED